jgi:hypothetical protein
MAAVVPGHIQEQFQSIIRVLSEKVGQEATRTYLKSLCADASVDMLLGRNRQSKSALERRHAITSSQRNGSDDTSGYSRPSPPALNSPNEAVLTMTSLSEDIPSPVHRPSVSNPDTSILSSGPLSAKNKSLTLCQKCTCERCAKPQRYKKGTDGNGGIPDTVTQGFLRPTLLEFLSEYWETLKMNGLYYHESAQSFQWTLHDSPVHVRRLHYHLILDHLGIEDDLYQWRRSIAEINNLYGYKAFVAEAEAESQIKQRHHRRRTGETNNQKAHKDYLAYIYADRAPKDFDKAKQALKKNLEFGRRWSILVDGYVDEDNTAVPGLSLGVLLLCGPYIKKKMSFPIPLENYALTKVQLQYENATIISEVTCQLYP